VSHVPGIWAFALLALAAFRLWKLIAHDSILDRPRDRLLNGRDKLAEFIQCPWCLGFWLALSWWLAWLISHTWATAAAVPFALSAAVGLVATAYFALTGD
jgi:hypothetical protein